MDANIMKTQIFNTMVYVALYGFEEHQRSNKPFYIFSLAHLLINHFFYKKNL